jgi:hypothetical protein
MIFTSALLGHSRVDRSIKALAILYGVLGITAAVAFLIPDALSILGFVAWGSVLLAIALLVAIRSAAGNRRPRGARAA